MSAHFGPDIAELYDIDLDRPRLKENSVYDG